MTMLSAGCSGDATIYAQYTLDVHFEGPAVTSPPGDAPAVEFRDVSFAFDEHVILDHVSFVVPPGSMRVVLGPSGAGKSILLKLILGLFRPDNGEIFVNGHRIDHLREDELLRIRAD